MSNYRFFALESAWSPQHFFLPGLALVICLTATLVSRALDAALATSPLESASPAEKIPPRSRGADFNSQGYRISKAVRLQRSLNALVIAARFAESKKVGRYVELPKELDPSESGEYFIVTWKYSGKSAPRKTTFTFEYGLSEEDHLETITRHYPNLRRGTYHLHVENTGRSYRRRGRIELWRVSIFADRKLVARKESFLWTVFRGEQEAYAER